MFHFSIRITSSNTTKVVISVSKKVSKSAVVRNTIKRRLRPILKELVLDLNPAGYLVIAKPGAEKIKGAELKGELEALFKKS